MTMAARRPIDTDGDVSDTLSDLERKLRDLERELSSVGHDPVRPPAPPAATPAPAPAPAATPSAQTTDVLVNEARERLGGLDAQVDELLRFREQLQRSARELEAEYARVLSRLGAPSAGAAPAAAPVAEPLRAPIAPPEYQPLPAGYQPPPAAAVEPVLAPAPYAPVAPPVPHGVMLPPPPSLPVAPPLGAASPHDAVSFEGPVVIDAGPFTDISGLSAFEQGLATLPGVQDVYVSGFEGNRALVEMRLGSPIALVAAMRSALPSPFTVTEAGQGRVRIDVHPTPGNG